MYNEEMQVPWGSKGEVFACVLICIFSILIVSGVTWAFIVSCTPDESSLNLSSSDLSKPLESETELQVSIFDDITDVFGDNSVFSVLNVTPFDSLTQHDRDVATNIVQSAKGIIQWNDQCVKIEYGGVFAQRNLDGTYYIMEQDGYGSGNVWLDTELSRLVPQLNAVLGLFLTTPDSVAAKYQQCTPDMFTAYCNQIKEAGFANDIFESSVLFKGTNNNGYTLSVSYSNSIISIQLKSPIKE